jgi:hypothetical protein
MISAERNQRGKNKTVKENVPPMEEGEEASRVKNGEGEGEKSKKKKEMVLPVPLLPHTTSLKVIFSIKASTLASRVEVIRLIPNSWMISRTLRASDTCEMNSKVVSSIANRRSRGKSIPFARFPNKLSSFRKETISRISKSVNRRENAFRTRTNTSASHSGLMM